MRLTCPECDALYEVDAALIPPEGRAVECARCGHGWHEPGRPPAPIRLGDADLAPRIEAEGDDEDDLDDLDPYDFDNRPAFGSGPRVLPPRPSAAVLEILREEAQRELAQRDLAQRTARERTDAEAVGGEAATPDGDAAPDPQSAPPSAGIHQPELIVAELVRDDELPGARPATPDGVAEGSGERRDSAPDWRQGRTAPAPRPARDGQWSDPDRPHPHGVPAAASDGYRAGFGLAVGLAVLLAGAYLAAPPLTGQGRIGAGLSEYRLAADRGRLWLHDRVIGAPGS